MDDSALVQLVQKGNVKAFNLLVERWHSKIHRFAYGFFANADDANEITQKTFIKVYQKVHGLDEPGRFSAWIYKVANNLCLDELKRAGRKKTTSLETVLSMEFVSDNQNPALQMETRELGDVIQKALLTLPDEQRVVVILKEFEGLKFREIAEILDEPENTVKSRMYYGLKSLRKILEKWNIPNQYLNYD